MNQLKQKLRSQSGASITFALLLFLVCAVLSVVILAAATASAGRLAKIGEVDQRYYAVTSASAVLKNMIDGKTATISEVRENPGDTPTVYVLDGVASGTRKTELIAASAAAEQTITRDAATRYYNSKHKIPESGRVPFTSQTSTLNLALEGTSVPNPCPLDLTVVESFDGSGNLILTVGNEHSFQQKLVFSVTESENDSERNYYSTNAAGEVITHKECIHNYVLTWSLAGVEVVGAAVQ